MWANASSNDLPAQSTILQGPQGPIGHGRWIPGGNMYKGAPMYSSPLSSRGFGQALPSARHPSDTREGFSNEDRVDRADRAAMWREMSGSVRKRLDSAHTYDALVMLAVTNESPEIREHLSQIDKDLLRTFPENPLFCESRETILGLHEGDDGDHGALLEPLRRVLSAYCMRNPSIGYCQAMNFVAGSLLLVLREDDAFWVLCCIIEDIVVGYYAKDMVALRTDLRTLEKVTAATLPQIYEHLQKLGLPLELASMRWFLSLFTSVFHQQMVTEILDELFTTGRKVLFQVAVGFMTHVQGLLLQCQETEEALAILNARARTPTGFLSCFKFSLYQLAGLNEIRTSVAAQIKCEDQIPALVPSDQKFASPLSQPPPAVGNYKIVVRVLRGVNLPTIGTGMPNCYVCASMMNIGQFLPLDQHLMMSSIHVVQSNVHECSTQPTWNCDFEFLANGDVRNLVLTVYHKDMYSQDCDVPLGQINIGLQQGTVIKEQWYRVQDKRDLDVFGADGRHSLIQLNMSYSESAKEPSIENIPSSVSIIAKKAPAAVTRRVQPTAPPILSHGSSLGNESPVNIEVTLDMEYASIIGAKEVFKLEISNDLARAVLGIPDKIHILSVRQGSVIVDAKLFQGLCPNGQSLLNALENLEHQVHDPSSLLKKGRFTRYVLRIRRAPADDNDSSLGMESDVDDSIMDIPLQIDTDSPSYSPVQIEKSHSAQPTWAASPLKEPQHEAPEAPPRPSMIQKLDHYHPSHLRPLDIRESFVEMPRYHSSTAPMSPPLLHDPKQAYQNPFMYPMDRGLGSQQPNEPIQMQRPQQPGYMRRVGTHQQPNEPIQMQRPQQPGYMQHPVTQMAQPLPTQQQHTPGWLPIPSTWYGRYKQHRTQQKQIKSVQREEAMERLRQQERARASQTKAGRAGVVSKLWTMLSPAENAHFSGNVHPAPTCWSPMPPRNVAQVHSPSLPQQPRFASPQYGPVAPMPVPRLKEKPPEGQTHDANASRATLQQQQRPLPMPGFGASSKYELPMTGNANRPLFGENPSEQSDIFAGQERVARWISATAPQITPAGPFGRKGLPVVNGVSKTGDNHYMPQPMEPNVAHFFAGQGTVRFQPGIPDQFSRGNPSGKWFESFSGHNTPIRYGTFSPVALSAMTAPSPQVRSSLWSSIEMPIGDSLQRTQAFPRGYDPSKPYAPPPGAFILRPQEVTGRSVANPQESMYMQNRWGDVVIQPSRQPPAIRVGDNKPFHQAPDNQQRSATSIIGGNPDNPVYYPRLPGQGEFNVSVEALNFADDLDQKLAAQSRFMSLCLPDHQDALQEAKKAIARFDEVRERSAAILKPEFPESGWGVSSLGSLRLESPGSPEDNRRQSWDLSGRAWNELGPEDLIELM